MSSHLLFSAQKGDIIDVISMNATGVWEGRLNGKLGTFKFINVEVIPEQRVKKFSRVSRKACPSSVDELLCRIGLKEYTEVFVTNG